MLAVERIRLDAKVQETLAPSRMSLPAAGTVMAAQMRLGYVDSRRVLVETREGRAAKAKLKRDFDEQQRRHDELVASLKRDEAMLEQQKRDGSIPPDELSAKKAVLEERASALNKAWSDARARLSDDEKRLTAESYARVGAVAQEVARADGYLLIFDKKECGLLFALEALDLSEEVVRRFDEWYPPK